MSASKTTTSALTDTAFNKQADAVRESLKNFETISSLNNALDLAKAAMEALLAATVRVLLFKRSFYVSQNNLFSARV